ncbi:MAG TPA: chromate efflux transporter [Chloroflexota bacterium]|nr:chromate efflux transporter [Chloroflexota bacterium]
MDRTGDASPTAHSPAFEILGVALRLGLTSFGGPIAHLGYFQQEYVIRRRWLDAESFADLVALCQFLPGPASSQVGIAIGMRRGGLAGAIAAWLGFTLPSAVALVVFAYAVRGTSFIPAQLLHGLIVAAVAVVAQAVWTMAQRLAPDRPRGTIAVVAAMVALLWPVAAAQPLIIAAAGLVGWRLLPRDDAPARDSQAKGVRLVAWGRRPAILSLAAFFALLIVLPLLRQAVHAQSIALFDSFYRVGALVFGGGHVVLPLLQREVVPAGWVSQSQFLAGYGAAQAVPGPLFTFAAYLGAVMRRPPNGWAGAALATVAIFLPSFLLVAGIMPFWDTLRRRGDIQSALRGINAAVVGLLLAALYQPVWTGAIHSATDVVLALLAFTLLVLWKRPPWLAVLATAALSWLLSLHG